MYSLLRRLAPYSVLTATLAVTGCAPLTVNSFVDRKTDLSVYRTYAWGPADNTSTGDPRLDSNRFFEERVRAQVDKELGSHGYEKIAGGTPDLLVHYHANFAQEIDIRQLDARYDTCGTGDCRPYIYDKGTLFVDLVDARADRLVWRGWAEGSVDGVIDNQAWMEQRIDEAVAKILRRLPNRS
jgi:hypothetical protein